MNNNMVRFQRRCGLLTKSRQYPPYLNMTETKQISVAAAISFSFKIKTADDNDTDRDQCQIPITTLDVIYLFGACLNVCHPSYALSSFTFSKTNIFLTDNHNGGADIKRLHL